MFRPAALIFIVAISNMAQAQQCESVIELSKTRSTVVQDNKAVSQHASNFCREYSSVSNRSASRNFGASYKFLSATFGSSSASADEVASKYCASDNASSASSDAYRQYIENIAPGAFGAYEQCVKMSEQSIRFNIDSGSILPTEFSLSVSFTSASSGLSNTSLAFSGSSDVTCKWDQTGETVRVLRTGSTALLKCVRADQSRRSYVTVVDSGSGRNLPLTLPWQAFDSQGIPINWAQAIENQLSAAQARINDIEERLTALSAQADSNESRYVKINDKNYLKSRDTIRLFGPGFNECIYGRNGNGAPVVTGDCSQLGHTTWRVEK